MILNADNSFLQKRLFDLEIIFIQAQILHKVTGFQRVGWYFLGGRDSI